MRRIMKKSWTSKLKKLNNLRNRVAALGLPGLDSWLIFALPISHLWMLPSCSLSLGASRDTNHTQPSYRFFVCVCAQLIWSPACAKKFKVLRSLKSASRQSQIQRIRVKGKGMIRALLNYPRDPHLLQALCCRLCLCLTLQSAGWLHRWQIDTQQIFFGQHLFIATIFEGP